MAEIELRELSRQSLSCRIPNQKVLQQKVPAWAVNRNHQQATVNWRFTTHDARIKLKRLYSSFDE